MLYVYDNEDNEPMQDQWITNYTGYINERKFRETGILIVEGERNNGEIQSA